MTTSSQTWTTSSVQAAGTKVQIVKGGQGEPLLIFHDELGHPGWLRYHEALSQSYTLHIPSHSGFGETERQEWIMNMRDMAGWYLDVLDELGLDRVNAIGFSLGGWLAAEMATMCPHVFKKLVLVGAAGVRPPWERSSTCSWWWPKSSSSKVSPTRPRCPSSRRYVPKSLRQSWSKAGRSPEKKRAA